MAAGDVANTAVKAWKVSFGTDYLGYTDKVNLSGLKLITKPIKVGSLGDVPMGLRIIGLEGIIRVEFREVNLDMIKKLTPWYTSGSVPLSPEDAVDLYTLAKSLTLHPEGVADATVDEDVNLIKAAPGIPFTVDRDGVADEVWAVDFTPFPDRSKLPKKVYGYIGAVPA